MAVMHSVEYSIFVIFAASLLPNIESLPDVIPVAGKCRTFTIIPTPMDFAGLANLHSWELIYTTGSYPYGNVDHEFRYTSPIRDNVFRVDDIRTLKDNTTNRHTYIGSFYEDGIVYEETVDINGVRHMFRLYTLALSVDYGMLYYRCSDVGDPDLDTRFIQIPKGRTISDAGLNYLMAIEKKYNFKGTMYPLPRALIKKS